MAGTSLKNLRVFEELCGKSALQNVILVTTMWDEIDEEEGEERERELKSEYWRPMLERRSTTSRFKRTRESAFTLVDPLIGRANKRISLLLQQEMVDMKRQLPETSAGCELYSKMGLLVRQRQELLDRIRDEMKRAEGDRMVLEHLQQEQEKLQINLEETVNKMRELELPLGKGLGNMAGKVLDIEQPVLNPKYSSIQPTSDLGLPSDQIFTCQDPHDSENLSTARSVNDKETQENPPQKTRSIQEIPQQTVDSQKVRPAAPVSLAEAAGSTTRESETEASSLQALQVPTTYYGGSFFSHASNIFILNSTLIASNSGDSSNRVEDGSGLFAPQLYSPSTLFTGQKTVLDKLKDHFAPRTEDHLENRHFLLLHGMGGIGKTQICLKFIEETSRQFSRVFWIDASSLDAVTLSLKRYFSSAAAPSVQSILQSIAHLKEEWLIVFDGADSLQVVENSIPPGCRGNILITSRNPFLDCLTSFYTLEVVEMEEEDAISLLLKGCCLKDRDSAIEIVKVLGCLPLAVDQAAASIRAGLYDIKEYVQQFCHHRQHLMTDPVFKGASKYEQSVYGTWELSLKKIEEAAMQSEPEAQAAVLILQTFAFCYYDNIPEDIFSFAAQESRCTIFLDPITELLSINKDGHWDNLLFRRGLNMLLSSSLIRKSSSSALFSVHPLVHYWSRDRMQKSEKQKLCHIVSMLLACAVPEDFGSQDYAFRQLLLPHIKANQNFSDQIGLKRVFDDYKYTKFGLVFKENGNWKEAEDLQLQVANERRKELGPEHLSTLNSLGNLASTYCHQGRWKDAEELESQIVNVVERVLGQDHPDTLRSKGNLASTYRNQGNLLEAEKLQVHVLNHTRKKLGNEHSDTLASMGNLATTYRNLGHWKEAEILELQVMNALMKNFGEEHPDTLTSMGNLATIYRKQGKWQEAEKLEFQVMNVRKKVFGLEHPTTLTSIGGLALTYRKQGRWKEVRDLQVQVMDTTKGLLGEEHPDTLICMGNLATTYKKQGQWKEAEDLEVQVCNISKKVLGEEHPDTLTSMGNLASIYRNQKCLAEAEKLQIEVVNTKKRILGEDHPDTLMSIGGLASIYCNQGYLKKAEGLEVQVMEKSKALFGEEHPDTLTSMGNLALTYCKQKHWKRAEKLELQVMNTRQRLHGKKHPDTLVSMGNLASIYRRLEKLSKAKELEVQVLEMRREIFGAAHPDTLTSMANLSRILKAQNCNDEAIEMMQNTVTICKDKLGLEHHTTKQSEAILKHWNEKKKIK